MNDPRILGNGGLVRQLQESLAQIIRTEIGPLDEQRLAVITNQDGNYLEKLDVAVNAAWVTVVVGLPKWRIETTDEIVAPIEIRVMENCRLNRAQVPYRTGSDVCELIAAALWERRVSAEWLEFREFEVSVLTEAPDLVHQLTTTTRTLGHIKED
jgi:hypothetical protein